MIEEWVKSIKFDDLTIRIQTSMSLSSITVIVIIVLRHVHLIMYEFAFFYRVEFFSIGPNFFEIPNGQSLTFKFQISTVINKKKNSSIDFTLDMI